ncbi:MAG: MBL fold metallo-hydrolase [Chloroflexota bacterium]
MKTTEITKNLTQLTLMGIVNCYFVHEEDGLTLIDAGMAGREKGILAAALDKPIKRLLLTHAHGDHVGCLAGLADALPEAEIIFGQRTAVFLSGNRALQTDEPQAKLRGTYATLDTQATRLVDDGDTVGSLQVIATPGHTPDHLSFFDTRDGSLIAGDALQTLGGIAVAGKMRWLFPLPALATWHKETAVSSAKKLLALNPARLAVGHGRVLENPMAAMAQAIQQAE